MERYEKQPKFNQIHREQTGRKPAQAGSLREAKDEPLQSAMNREFLQKTVFVL